MLQPKVNYINEFYAIADIGGVIKEYSSVTEITEMISNPIEGVSLHVTKVDNNND